MMHGNARWIWISDQARPNEYAVFEGKFCYDGGDALFSVAAETDYILWINGERASFGQFAGFPREKYYDEVEISPLCVPGENVYTLTVRYEGVNSATHIDDGPGVIFSLTVAGKPIACSGSHTLGGVDNRYIQHQNRPITGQLGLTSGMRSGTYQADLPCVLVEKTYNLKKRPVKKTVLQPFVPGKPCAPGGRLYDLGREEAGYLRITVRSPECCRFQVAYGEHIADGGVRARIGDREFTLDFETEAGEQTFFQLFLRVAARYLEVYAPDDLEILSIGIVPALYPLTEKPTDLQGLHRQIYDTCVRTLRLCMNTHYEDCPWREQALYVMDSRNQMLCGYYAFEQTEFQRENLALIAKGTRPDGFLELTYPAVNTPAIPFFSLMYPVAVHEYILHTGDISILAETMPTMLGFMRKLPGLLDERGLLREFGQPYWNFYEWSEGSDGGSAPGCHLIFNCAFVHSAHHFMELCKLAGRSYDVDLQYTIDGIRDLFFEPETGLFYLDPAHEICSQLGNAFALLIGLGDERTVTAVKECRNMIPATLSMQTFVYDALLLRDRDPRAFILADIAQNYGEMLRCGATSFWETLEGQSAFGNAGSLCHGWSAMPVYYYRILQ